MRLLHGRNFENDPVWREVAEADLDVGIGLERSLDRSNERVCPNAVKPFTGADRNSSGVHVKAGILEKIEYPTGGNVQFTFETNQSTLTYLSPLNKSVNAHIDNNPNNNGVPNAVVSSPTIKIPTGDPNVGTGVCATILLNWGYPAGTDATIISKYKPTVEFWETNADGDYFTKIASYTNITPNASTSYNVTLSAGKYYLVKVIANMKNCTVDATLNYATPQVNTIPYYLGGLRLKQKTVYEPVAMTSSVTSYTYSVPTYKTPVYEHVSYQYSIPGITCGEGCSGTMNTYDRKQYTTLIANYGGMDNEINYPEITTTYGVSGENGKTITHYIPSSNDYFWRKGKIGDQQDFNASGRLLKKVVNHYTIPAGVYENVYGVEVGATSAHPCLAGDPGNFSLYSKSATAKLIFNPCEWYVMDSSTTYEYDTQNANVYSNQTVYVYCNAAHMQLCQSFSINSKGKINGDYFRFPLDYTYNGTLTGAAAVMKELTNRHIYNQPIEEVVFAVGDVAGTAKISNATLNTFKLNNNQIVRDAIYKLRYNSSTGNGAEIVTNYGYAGISNGQLVYDNRYELENNFSRYDLNQNLIELKQRDNTYALRRSVNGDVWAKTTSAIYDETAYSNFEHGNIAADFTNWNYNNANLFTSTTPPPLRGTFNGDKCYKFSGTNDIISNRVALNRYQMFKISFWSKGGTATVSRVPYGATGGLNVVLRKGPTRMGWTYYEGYFSSGVTVQVAGTGMIDELRLHPASARMETYVYKQGIGLWGKCNENNQNTFWSYDEFGRLRVTTDQDGYILGKNEYQYLQPQN